MASPVVHFEIGCKDAAKNSAFYKSLFGWSFESMGPSQMITNIGMGPDGKGGPGIGGHLNQLGHPPHNYVTVYVQVDDLAKTLAQAESLGGKTIVPPQEVPGMGHFAWFMDPEGNGIGLWKPAAHG